MGHTTSRSRETRKPIERISLNLKLDGEASELQALRRNLHGSKLSKEGIALSMQTTDPKKVVEELRKLGDSVRVGEKNPKGFKRS